VQPGASSLIDHRTNSCQITKKSNAAKPQHCCTDARRQCISERLVHNQQRIQTERISAVCMRMFVSATKCHLFALLLPLRCSMHGDAYCGALRT
jgi:hypothetical protein